MKYSISVFPSVESMLRLVGAVLVDVNEGWMGAGFMDASSLRSVGRSAAEPEPPTPELAEKARSYVLAAIEGKGEAA